MDFFSSTSTRVNKKKAMIKRKIKKLRKILKALFGWITLCFFLIREKSFVFYKRFSRKKIKNYDEKKDWLIQITLQETIPPAEVFNKLSRREQREINAKFHEIFGAEKTFKTLVSLEHQRQ